MSEIKEVYFNEYCCRCKHYLESEDHPKCAVCLNEPFNTYSHKPVEFEEKK